ncbi:type II secretion system F family protein [Candidatus Micrarchaeota archaeon]|nr:type II secretion system F family protein [Candidatus Micrarchaeota archaeon]MBU1165384.1 type II secretion system F family protein [Candidatus Micrarchaeota archaeon]MBU1886217.1 type II secretion system F family protein [Candidatus Micrarchaeota archaeon]
MNKKEAVEKTQKKRGPFTSIAEMFASRFPNLKNKLKMADMSESPIEFLEKVVTSTIYISLGLIIVSYLFMITPLTYNLKTDIMMFVAMVIIPLLLIPLVVFFYLMLYPEANRIKRQREMDYEIVFAGRHIVIALKSGMPLFDTFVGASHGYGEVSREFSKLVDNVVLGMPMSQAIREIIKYNPSSYFNRMMMQIANSISSGSDVGGSLESVIDQISKEQIIALKAYSQKLTPVVMFYMVFGIIVPSLGIVLATVIFSVVSGGIIAPPSELLWVAFVLIALIQFIFLGYIESSRPKYLL